MACIHGCSVALQLLFFTCWTWSRQRRRRGRRPHDVHVRCLEVHGTIHMIVAKSAAWSYLKRAWGNALKFKRASRSLAKTGSWGPPKMVISCSVFDVFRRWSCLWPFLECNFLMCLCTCWCHLGDFLMCLLHFHSLFLGGCQKAFQGGLTCNFLMCLLHFSCENKHFLMCLLHFCTL